jgi:hypothetical protein
MAKIRRWKSNFEITKKQLMGERFDLFVVEFINPFSYN